MKLSAEDAARILAYREQEFQRCKDSFAYFVKKAWKYVSADSELVWANAHEILCMHLEALYAGKISKLIINIPPRTGKSRFASICFPAWVWLHNPKTQFIVASHGDKVIQDFGKSLVKLLRSDFYAKLQPEATVESNVARANIVNKAGGSWFGTTPHGQLLGIGGDILIFDDIVDPDGVDKEENKTVKKWIPETFMSRANRKDRARFVGIGQRLREDDPYAYCIENGWFPLVLPARYEGGDNFRTMPNGEEITQDSRTIEGELLCPELLSDEYLTTNEKMWPSIYAGQYQQRPSPGGSGIFQADWLNQQWETLPTQGTWLLSVDATFSDSKDSDFVAIQVWLYDKPNFYLVDQIRARMKIDATMDAIRRALMLYPKTHIKIVEKKANGDAIVDLMCKDVPGMVKIDPEGGKISRANAVSACFASHNIWLPAVFRLDPFTTIEMFRHEFLVFGVGKHDDMVDSATQAINWLLNQDVKMSVVSKGMMAAMTGAPPEVLKPKEEQPQTGYNSWRAQQLSRRR